MYTLPLSVTRQQHKNVYLCKNQKATTFIPSQLEFSITIIIIIIIIAIFTMADNTQSAFWESIPSNLRNAVEQAISTNVLEEKLSLSKESGSLENRYAQLERLLTDMAAQEVQDKQSSGHQTTQQISALFPLAMLQTGTNQYAAAEDTYRKLLTASPTSQPDLAATSNLIDVLNHQHKYAEAQSLSMQVLPLLQKELGATSPQYLGCMRKLMESLVGQGKGGEARQLLQRGMDLVSTIGDDDVKEEEVEAMQEMGRKIDSLG